MKILTKTEQVLRNNGSFMTFKYLMKETGNADMRNSTVVLRLYQIQACFKFLVLSLAIFRFEGAPTLEYFTIVLLASSYLNGFPTENELNLCSNSACHLHLTVQFCEFVTAGAGIVLLGFGIVVPSVG